MTTCLFIGALNTDFIHHWLTMIIVGAGLNFLFLSGTNMLRYGYREPARFKAQSFQDFLVFSMQGPASLNSGWFLYHWGWRVCCSRHCRCCWHPPVALCVSTPKAQRLPAS